MKKWVLVLFFGMPFLSVSAFFDVAMDDPDRPIFEHLRDVKVMNPLPDGSFAPDKVMTRAEALAVAMRAGGIMIPPLRGVPYFEDVPADSWYAPIVERALETKVVSGKTKQFRPNDIVTKAEYLTFLFRATGVKFDQYIRETDIALDVKTEDWFAPIFVYAKKYQISVLPADKYYRPYKWLSRREVAIMTFRQLKLFHGNSSSKVFIELQATLQQYMTLLQAGQEAEATTKIQRIMALTNELTRAQNNKDAIAANAIALALKHFSESLRYMKTKQNLKAIESLYLAENQAMRAGEKSQSMAPFANELKQLISQAVFNMSGVPRMQNLTQNY